MPFPALSTGHFIKYETKCKYSVVVKVQWLRKKGKTVTPSRKLQAKGEIACMTAACLRLSSSLVTRWLRARRLPFRRAKDTNIMRKIYQPPLFNDKNAFRKSVYLSVYLYFPADFQLYARRMCVYGRYAPGCHNLVDQSRLDPVH